MVLHLHLLSNNLVICGNALLTVTVPSRAVCSILEAVLMLPCYERAISSLLLFLPLQKSEGLVVLCGSIIFALARNIAAYKSNPNMMSALVSSAPEACVSSTHTYNLY